jgi:hypothetical protein
VSSRADLPLWFSRDNINNDDVRQRLNPVYLTGGHIERKFGILNVAANYVNTYKSASDQARHYSGATMLSDIRDSMTGSVPTNPEEVQYLVVKVEDGSRFDAGGPRIYDMQMLVEGIPRKDMLYAISRENWSNDLYQVKTQKHPGVDFYQNVFFLDSKSVPNYKIFQDQLTGNTVADNFILFRKTDSSPIPKDFSTLTHNGTNYLEASGEDYLLFWFKVPTTVDKNGTTVAVSDVKFRSLIGNDYKISISEIYKNVKDAKFGQQTARYYQPIKEAPGNIKDLSNLGWITFEYGIQTADMIMGLRVNTDIKGFSLVAEFNKNFNFHQYPTLASKKYHDNANAYYINVKKEIGKFTVGTEYFNIDPNYSTTLENMDITYYGMNDIPLSSWADEFLSNVDTRGGNEGKIPATSIGWMNNTVEINSVDDNDDKDRYPDFHIYSAVRDMNGIYPGQDDDGDQRPDTNENENLVPDYYEPFFLYNSDPTEYSYGDDLNQNSVIDNREDDDKPDYPYNRDTRGYHVFGSWGSQQG